MPASFLRNGDVLNAQKCYDRAIKYETLMYNGFTAAAEVYIGNTESGMIIAEGIKNGCEASVKLGLALTLRRLPRGLIIFT